MSGGRLADSSFDDVPMMHREAARTALSEVVGPSASVSVQTVSGGASGALVRRVDVDGGASLLLRIDTARDPFRNPARVYPCMRSAAAAGIAPRVHVADEHSGIVVMDFVHQRPITEHEGGDLGVVRALGELVAQLQSTPAFAPLMSDFGALLQQMVSGIDRAGVFAPGLLAPVHDGLERIRAAYPWSADTRVSSHNDVNPFNVLFDGTRLWLVDWETAFGNDPVADVACVANNFAEPAAQGSAADELAIALLTAWHGRPPDAHLRARFDLMRLLNHLFYACLMLSGSIGTVAGEADLDALSVEQFTEAVMTGRLAMGSPGLLHTMGKMKLAGFLAGVGHDQFDETLRVVAG